MRNPLFYSYNHVLVPYCSSDVWLGEQTGNTEAVDEGTLQCKCLTSSSISNPCFNYNPQSPNLQFTFRGKIIYQSVIQQLLTDHYMMEAERVILSGSNSGGVGVINHAKWTQNELSPDTQLMVFTDSSWFINFQDGIDETFLGGTADMSTSRNVFSILLSQNLACNDTVRFGYACCVSAQCMLTEQSHDGGLKYYPQNTPMFALFSIYDIYLPTPALGKIADVNSNANLGVVLEFLKVTGEYGGTMNYTLDVVTSQVCTFSHL